LNDYTYVYLWRNQSKQNAKNAEAIASAQSNKILIFLVFYKLVDLIYLDHYIRFAIELGNKKK
jgi:hypothetical protein